MYDLSAGKCLGLDLRLGYIVLRGDPDEVFFSYGFNPETSKVLFSSSKERIMNTFTCTAFRKHYKKIVHECLIQENVLISFFTFLLQPIESEQSVSFENFYVFQTNYC